MLSTFEQVHLQERDLQEGLGVDGRSILEIGIYTRNWVDSAQNRDYWSLLRRH